MASRKRNKLSIAHMCKIAGVSRSGYYSWTRRRSTPARRDLQDEEYIVFIRTAFDHKGYKKSARQIRKRLKRQYGITMNLKKIRRLMKKYGLICPIRKINPVKAMLKKTQIHKIP